jgi:hypothetical protein
MSKSSVSSGGLDVVMTFAAAEPRAAIPELRRVTLMRWVVINDVCHLEHAVLLTVNAERMQIKEPPTGLVPSPVIQALVLFPDARHSASRRHGIDPLSRAHRIHTDEAVRSPSVLVCSTLGFTARLLMDTAPILPPCEMVLLYAGLAESRAGLSSWCLAFQERHAI